MGKRLIIKGANFATNGMKDNHTENLIAPTANGQVVINPDSSHYGKIGTGGANWYYYEYVHSNKSILLYPGDTVALMNMPGVAIRAAILAYKYASVDSPETILLSNSNLYPIGDCATVNTTTSGLTFGTVVAGTGSIRNSNSYPITIKNTSSNYIWCIVFVAAIEANGNKTPSINTSNTPEFTYRIYADDLTPYEEPGRVMRSPVQIVDEFEEDPEIIEEEQSR